ncbi:Glyoxylate reductase [Fusarium oxysporum f. sp. albedinis]|nr:Glyoxylate reductase [Fusarium oxysporum f. sp. albedinis]
MELIKPVLGRNSMKRRSLHLADLQGPFYDAPPKSPLPLPLSTQGSLWSSAQPRFFLSCRCRAQCVAAPSVGNGNKTVISAVGATETAQQMQWEKRD